MAAIASTGGHAMDLGCQNVGRIQLASRTAALVMPPCLGPSLSRLRRAHTLRPTSDPISELFVTFGHGRARYLRAAGCGRDWQVADHRPTSKPERTATMAKQPIANPNVTLTPEALKQVIAAAIAEHEQAKAEQAKTDTTADMDRLCIKALVRAGYKAENIQPRQNVRTYNLWLQEGRRVKAGEASVRVKTLRLFHIDQTEPMNAVEKKAALAALEEKRAKRTSDVLPKPSPVAAAPVTAAPNAKGKGAPIQP